MGEDGSKPAIGHKYTSEHERSDIELYSRFVCSVCIVLYDIAYRILYFTSTCAVIIKNRQTNCPYRENYVHQILIFFVRNSFESTIKDRPVRIQMDRTGPVQIIRVEEPRRAICECRRTKKKTTQQITHVEKTEKPPSEHSTCFRSSQSQQFEILIT